MADSNSEPPRCPCGFWGSVQNQGLCSKCYKEKNAADHVSKSLPQASKPTANTSGQPSTSQETSLQSSNVPDENKKADVSETADSEAVEAKDSQQVTSEDVSSTCTKTEEDASPSTGTKSDNFQTNFPRDSSAIEDPDKPVQKNKKRCYKCNGKLDMAQREIGRCKCDYIFCNLHRLPEQHDCIFDHKESGRQQARDKIVKPTRHMGTSLKRLDSN